jgi:predicted dehydrogenase
MINFAIIGTSWITASFITSAHATQKWALKAIYSRTESSASSFASQFPDHKDSLALYTSLTDLAADTNVHAVYIASPNSLHYAHAKQMLEAGKHVVLEKPACSREAELKALFEVAREQGVVLVEAWRHIQERNFQALKRSIKEKLGPVYGASITYAQYSSRYDKVLAGETPNIFNLDMGGGALADLGVYTVAAAIALFGVPLNATYHPYIISTGADGGGVLILSYPTFVVHCNGSKIYNSSAPSEIYGEKGTLSVASITDIEGVTFWDARSKSKEEVGGKREELNLKEEAEEFARIINEKDWGVVRELEEHSLAVVRVTEGVRRENGLLFPGERK